MSTEMYTYLGIGALGYPFFETTSTFTDDTPIRAGADTVDSFIFSVPQDGQIDTIGLYIVDINSTGTNAGGYEIALKTLDSGGRPATTNYGGSSGTVYVIDDFVSGWNWIDLSVPATGTAGDFSAAIIKEITTDANNYVGTANYYTAPLQFTLPRRYTSSSYAPASPIMAVRYSNDFVYGRPLRQFTSNVFDNADSPDEVGAKIFPFAQVTCNGVVFSPKPAFLGAPTTILLYDSDDTIVTSVSFSDREHPFYTADFPAILHWDEVTLSSGTHYRLVVRPDQGTAPITVCGYTFITGTYKYCIPDGLNWSRTYRTNGGAWTDDDDTVPHLGLVLNNITLGSGGNGGGGTGTATVASSSGSYYGWA